MINMLFYFIFLKPNASSLRSRHLTPRDQHAAKNLPKWRCMRGTNRSKRVRWIDRIDTDLVSICIRSPRLMACCRRSTSLTNKLPWLTVGQNKTILSFGSPAFKMFEDLSWRIGLESSTSILEWWARFKFCFHRSEHSQQSFTLLRVWCLFIRLSTYGL